MSERHQIPPEQLLRQLKLATVQGKTPISGMDLATRCGVKQTKRVRETVNYLRSHGYLIGSGPSGYFIPKTREEALEGYDFITTLFDPLRRAVDGYKSAIDREFGPATLFDQEAV